VVKASAVPLVALVGFAVDSEVVATADGRRAFVFSKPATLARSGFQHGVNR
jgi:hypothetical protein